MVLLSTALLLDGRIDFGIALLEDVDEPIEARLPVAQDVKSLGGRDANRRSARLNADFLIERFIWQMMA
ncbi:MAG TPA: hypothetical protein EYP25_01840 [Anaerolineae bacterium]|nr:hypothetical protein [Anaerolineae bacterium]